ncbi:MAG: TPM domain-containing protein [Verrucomicrobiota bacterium]
MRTKHFLGKLDNNQIVQAIAAAEAKTSGEIRVYVQRGSIGDAVAAARKQFRKLRMHKTRERNGVLIFVAPRVQKFAVIGDRGVHEKCGDVFWQKLIDSMRSQFKNESFGDALVEAITEAGSLLAQHFPKKPSDPNELSDEIVED